MSNRHMHVATLEDEVALLLRHIDELLRSVLVVGTK